nr:dicer-like protein 4 isoform X1 [Tanacetum cinerariifolium]
LFRLDNLLRKKGNSEPREKEEHFVELPPENHVKKEEHFVELPSEVCVLKVIGFLREIGSEVSADRVLEAITAEIFNERVSLERLEVLGDAFLKLQLVDTFS